MCTYHNRIYTGLFIRLPNLKISLIWNNFKDKGLTGEQKEEQGYKAFVKTEEEKKLKEKYGNYSLHYGIVTDVDANLNYKKFKQ